MRSWPSLHGGKAGNVTLTKGDLAARSNRIVALMYLLEALAGLGRGSYLVCFGWTTLVTTGEVAKVGQVFVVSMLTILFGSHVIGVIVDRANRRHTVWVSHSVIAAVMAIVGWALEDTASFNTVFFFAGVIVITAARIAYESAFDATLKQLVTPENLTTVLARARALHLLSTAVVTVFTGWCLGVFGASIAFYCSAAFSVALVALSGVLPNMTGGRPGETAPGFGADFIEGLALLRNVPGLAPVVLLAGIALPIGQLSNAVLSSLVHDDLGLGSREFGLIDGAWPIGGLAASILISVLAAKWAGKIHLGTTAVLVALSTIAMAFTQSVVLLAIFHGCMGYFTWLSRILVDAQVLHVVRNEHVGRAKSNVTFAFGFVAIVMCLSPTLVPTVVTGHYFLAWGGAILVAGTLYGIFGPRARPDPGREQADETANRFPD